MARAARPADDHLRLMAALNAQHPVRDHVRDHPDLRVELAHDLGERLGGHRHDVGDLGGVAESVADRGRLVGAVRHPVRDIHAEHVVVDLVDQPVPGLPPPPVRQRLVLVHPLRDDDLRDPGLPRVRLRFRPVIGGVPALRPQRVERAGDPVEAAAGRAADDPLRVRRGAGELLRGLVLAVVRDEVVDAVDVSQRTASQSFSHASPSSATSAHCVSARCR